jgi:hypothetical protein
VSLSLPRHCAQPRPWAPRMLTLVCFSHTQRCQERRRSSGAFLSRSLSARAATAKLIQTLALTSAGSKKPAILPSPRQQTGCHPQSLRRRSLTEMGQFANTTDERVNARWGVFELNLTLSYTSHVVLCMFVTCPHLPFPLPLFLRGRTDLMYMGVFVLNLTLSYTSHVVLLVYIINVCVCVCLSPKQAGLLKSSWH